MKEALKLIVRRWLIRLLDANETLILFKRGYFTFKFEDDKVAEWASARIMGEIQDQFRKQEEKKEPRWTA